MLHCVSLQRRGQLSPSTPRPLPVCHAAVAIEFTGLSSRQRAAGMFYGSYNWGTPPAEIGGDLAEYDSEPYDHQQNPPPHLWKTDSSTSMHRAMHLDGNEVVMSHASRSVPAASFQHEPEPPLKDELTLLGGVDELASIWEMDDTNCDAVAVGSFDQSISHRSHDRSSSDLQPAYSDWAPSFPSVSSRCGSLGMANSETRYSEQALYQHSLEDGLRPHADAGPGVVHGVDRALTAPPTIQDTCVANPRVAPGELCAVDNIYDNKRSMSIDGSTSGKPLPGSGRARPTPVLDAETERAIMRCREDYQSCILRQRALLQEFQKVEEQKQRLLLKQAQMFGRQPHLPPGYQSSVMQSHHLLRLQEQLNVSADSMPYPGEGTRQHLPRIKVPYRSSSPFNCPSPNSEYSPGHTSSERLQRHGSVGSLGPQEMNGKRSVWNGAEWLAQQRRVRACHSSDAIHPRTRHHSMEHDQDRHILNLHHDLPRRSDTGGSAMDDLPTRNSAGSGRQSSTAVGPGPGPGAKDRRSSGGQGFLNSGAHTSGYRDSGYDGPGAGGPPDLKKDPEVLRRSDSQRAMMMHGDMPQGQGPRPQMAPGNSGALGVPSSRAYPSVSEPYSRDHNMPPGASRLPRAHSVPSFAQESPGMTPPRGGWHETRSPGPFKSAGTPLGAGAEKGRRGDEPMAEEHRKNSMLVIDRPREMAQEPSFDSARSPGFLQQLDNWQAPSAEAAEELIAECKAKIQLVPSSVRQRIHKRLQELAEALTPDMSTVDVSASRQAAMEVVKYIRRELRSGPPPAQSPAGDAEASAATRASTPGSTPGETGSGGVSGSTPTRRARSQG